MFGIGPWELLITFAIVLLLFGGKRLPEVASGLGQAIKNFKSAMSDTEKEISTSGTPKIIDSSAAEKLPNSEAKESVKA